MPDSSGAHPVVSIGIIAWNEEGAITQALESLLRQTLFTELARRGETAEIVCVTNGCTDRTPEFARQVLESRPETPGPSGISSARVVELVERGKLNAWNRYVHAFSAPKAEVLILMDGDIVIRERQSLWNMYRLLVDSPSVSVAVDQPVKDIGLDGSWSIRRSLSLAGSKLSGSAPAQMCGQLYAIRSSIARNILLPRDLGACEDGLIKLLVCTDFLTHESTPGRIQRAPEASHAFGAYLAVGEILRNRKRQAIGQTMIHILVDRFLTKLNLNQRRHLADSIRFREESDPTWLRRLLAAHLHRTRHFWNLYPGLLSARFWRWRRLALAQKVACLPAMGVDMVASLIGAWQAHRLLRRGGTDYWPGKRAPGLMESLSRLASPRPGPSAFGTP